jgi:hypothetical protein
MQRFAREHDCPPSGPGAQTVAAPTTQRVPAPQSESVWQGLRVWHAAGAAEAAEVRKDSAQTTSAATPQSEPSRPLIHIA